MTLAALDLDLVLRDRVRFRRGAIADLPALVREAGGSKARAFVVTDPGVVASGIVAAIASELSAAGVANEVFAEVEPNPGHATIEKGSAALREFGRRDGLREYGRRDGLREYGRRDGRGDGRDRLKDVVVVAIGGGSSMDTAKAVSLHATNRVEVRALGFDDPTLRPGRPIVAVPTTAGTGAETNSFGVITDAAAGRKWYIGHPSLLPTATILDPELTIGLPPRATAATGIDALSHALEGIMSRRANPLSMAIALEATRLIGDSLEAALADGTDVEARSQLLFAAHIAGIAQGITGLGLAHALAHPLGGRLDLPHGAALAAVLPSVMAWNEPVSRDRLDRIADALGVGPGGAVDRVAALIAAVGLSSRLAAFGVTPELAETLADDAVADAVINNTPRMPTREEVLAQILSLI
jgi:alcohol dehydrogenase